MFSDQKEDNSLRIGEIVVDLLVEYIEDDIQKIPAQEPSRYQQTVLAILDSEYLFNGICLSYY